MGILESCESQDPSFVVGTDQGNQPVLGETCPEIDTPDTASYLDHPRLHFSGLYQADVATINNYYDNFDTASFSLLDQLIKKPTYADFNPKGSNGFSFQNCTITMVCPLGLPCTTDDELVGRPLESATGHATGKIVDTDVEIGQAIMFGMTIGLDIHHSRPFVGRLKPVGEQDPWRNVWNGENIDPNWQTGFQSILENVEWNDHSPFLSRNGMLLQLRESHSKVLSIKFNLDHYHQENFSDPLFLYGRVTGTIGPCSQDGPVHYLRERSLQFVRGPNASGVVDTNKLRYTNVASFKVIPSTQHVAFDFGNAICRSTFDGSWITYMGDYLDIVTRNDKQLIARINLTTDDWYMTSAGIFDAPLTEVLLTTIESSAVDVYNDRDELVMQEVDIYSRPMNEFIKKLNPNDTWEVTFFVNHLGKSKSNHKTALQVHLASSHTPPDKTAQALSAFQIVNRDPDPSSNSTYFFRSNCSGMFTVQFKASDPGRLRRYVDGEVYRVSYVSDMENQGFTYLYVRVFDEFPVPDKPTWFGENGVYNILLQYDNLFPVMRKFLVLSDYNSVTKPSNLHFLRLSMTLSEFAPGHMPVTRDLSKGKKDMILKWLDKPERGDMKRMDFEELKKNLQIAIEVEHSTIPLYLYALFSIKPGSNVQAYSLIRSVLMEEMVHMALVSNILNAVGGRPDFTHEKFIPIFPGPMAGGLHPELTLRLGPLTKDLVKNVFMVLEEPRLAPIDGDSELHNKTIGVFYHRLEKSLIRLVKEMGGEENVFVGDPARQVDSTCFPPETASKMFPVTDLKSALRAMQLIVKEGEGSNQLNPYDGEGEVAHYYKFSEIYHGRTLVIDKETREWTYSGDPIPLDPDGVYPLISNPRLDNYPEGSRARLLATDFSRCYLSLLRDLQHAFNGSPEKVGETFGAMNFLSIKAGYVTELPLNEAGSKHAGPTFLNPLLLP